MATKVTGLQAALAALGDAAGPVVQRSMAEAIDTISARVRTRMDAHTKTGAMLRSLRIEKTGPMSYRISAGGQMAPYTKFVHDGTRPHVIKPRNKRMLRWPTGGAGFIFARQVNHPGYKGDPWFDDITPQVKTIFNDTLARKLNQPLKG